MMRWLFGGDDRADFMDRWRAFCALPVIVNGLEHWPSVDLPAIKPLKAQKAA